MQFELRPNVAVLKNDHNEVIEEAPSDAVARSYFAGGGIELGLLPPAVRWVSSDGLGIVLERPPQIINIAYKEDTYTIPVPWTIWGLRFGNDLMIEKSLLFARPYPLSAVNDELFVLPLPNMDTDCSVAVPNKRGETIGERLLPMVEKYWQRPFTGAYNNLLEDKTLVPDEWIEHLELGIGKYFAFLTSMNIESITFSDLKLAPTNALNDLTQFLERTNNQEEPVTTMDFFQQIVRNAKGI